MTEAVSNQALYRKWRSRTFGELVGQDHVTQTLRNALRRNRLGHAYLFSGPRGVGKTSAARILAKAANCPNALEGEPCDACDMCRAIAGGQALDVIEIDAASNNKVENVRDLRETVGFRPGQARYKFYILDEAHMMTDSAFNALLKTLEEPPPHVVFVLVTTEAYKLPATILSRCQRFDFHRVPLVDAMARLREIADAEGVAIVPAALELIAHSTGGSLRDAEVLLDQLMATGSREIELSNVEALVGSSGLAAAETLVEHVLARDQAAGIRHIQATIGGGVDPRQLTKEVVEYLRNLMLFKLSGSAGLVDVGPERLATLMRQAERATGATLVAALRAFSQAESNWRGALHYQLPLELAFLEITSQAESPGGFVAAEPVPSAKQAGVSRSPRPVTGTPAGPLNAGGGDFPVTTGDGSPRHTHASTPAVPAADMVSTAPAATERPATDAAGVWALVQRNWPTVVDRVGDTNKPLQALLRSTQPDRMERNVLVLRAKYAFHRERIEDMRNRTALEQVLDDVLGAGLRVRCEIGSGETVVVASDGNDHDGALNDPVVRAAIDLGARVVEILPASTDQRASDER